MCLTINAIAHKNYGLLTKNNLIDRLFRKKPKYTIHSFVAAEDIHVTKFLYVKKNKDESLSYVAPYMHTVYEMDKVYHLKDWLASYDVPTNGTSTHNISRGFHAYKENLEGVYSNFSYGPKCAICDAIIPAGSNYFVGTHGDIVSDTLIITGVLIETGSTDIYYSGDIVQYKPKKKEKSNKKKKKRKAKRRSR